MAFKKIFDRNAPINAGLFPIWFILSVAVLFFPSLHAGGFAPFVILMVLHWLFQFGKWIEFKLRPKKVPVRL